MVGSFLLVYLILFLFKHSYLQVHQLSELTTLKKKNYCLQFQHFPQEFPYHFSQFPSPLESQQGR